MTLYLVVETFANGDPVPVYKRFREQGRLAPPNLEYRGSWVTADLKRCFQLMECADRATLDEWITRWADLVDFEVSEVMSSAAAADAVARLE